MKMELSADGTLQKECGYQDCHSSCKVPKRQSTLHSCHPLCYWGGTTCFPPSLGTWASITLIGNYMHKNVNVLSSTELHFKMVEIINFMLCIFYNF